MRYHGNQETSRSQMFPNSLNDKLEIRSVELGICPMPSPQWTNFSYNYGRMHCAWTKRPYFHFWSKICRHIRVSRPRFPKKCENCGDK